MSKHTILIIEDEADLREAMKDLLEPRYDIIIAENGHAGWESAVGNAPHLILMDLKMPKMDGFEACRLFRSDSKLSAIPILIISGFASEEDRQRAYEIGAKEFIPKPFDFDYLITRIEAYLPKFNKSVA